MSTYLGISFPSQEAELESSLLELCSHFGPFFLKALMIGLNIAAGWHAI